MTVHPNGLHPMEAAKAFFKHTDNDMSVDQIIAEGDVRNLVGDVAGRKALYAAIVTIWLARPAPAVTTAWIVTIYNRIDTLCPTFFLRRMFLSSRCDLRGGTITWALARPAPAVTTAGIVTIYNRLGTLCPTFFLRRMFLPSRCDRRGGTITWALARPAPAVTVTGRGPFATQIVTICYHL